jgi:hypothetical protein
MKGITPFVVCLAVLVAMLAGAAWAYDVPTSLVATAGPRPQGLRLGMRNRSFERSPSFSSPTGQTGQVLNVGPAWAHESSPEA